MSPWKQAFENHQFVTKIDGAIASLEATSIEKLSSTELEQYARLIKALKFSRARLKKIDPELVSQSSLSNLGTWITAIANHIQSFASTGNSSLVQSANNVLDNVIEVVRS